MLALSTTAPLYAEAPISIINTTNLTFGAFAANNGGTISVSSSGMASTSGTVLRPSSSSSAAAAFSVSGEPDFVFAITLPSNGEAALSGTGGTMTLDGFVDSASGLGQLSPGGTQTLTVGATLNVGSSQQPGTYTGSFSVVVEYN